ncbi:hypothetical protein DFH08DRAFT_841316 [Mycena albidolilacea]|uniref:Uncharacterized protein n=1 Tax=Mycena albidolilacea TaxID=1033008 RepID=A0AAD7AMS1_9AGAR|nr:hypothetical protein DFH08DRAFT_841316 [Mycena albidolilacea]
MTSAPHFAPCDSARPRFGWSTHRQHNHHAHNILSFSLTTDSMMRQRSSEGSAAFQGFSACLWLAGVCCALCIPLIFLLFIATSVWLDFRQTVATQKELLSRITSETPISGLYGPGAWLHRQRSITLPAAGTVMHTMCDDRLVPSLLSAGYRPTE